MIKNSFKVINLFKLFLLSALLFFLYIPIANVSTTLVNVKAIIANYNSPQKVGTSIRLEPQITGGTELLVKYEIFNGEGWEILRDYSKEISYIWNPQTPGKYQIKVLVKDKDSLNDYDDYSVLDYTINPSTVNAQSLSATPHSPQELGTDILLRATATGGTDLLYKFYIYDGESWSVLRDYGRNNKFTWRPTKPGSYKLVVHVKDRTSNKAYDDYAVLYYEIDGLKVEPVVAKSLSGTPNSPQKAGTNILLRATATGGTDLLYKFHIYDGESWSVLRDYGRNNKFTWRPTKPGNYKLVVHVKDRSSNKKYDDYVVLENFKIEGSEISRVDAKSLSASPQSLNSNILLRATATGGNTLLYKFYAFDGKDWIVLRDYGQNNKFNWTPSKSGNYKLVVHVKDKNSKNRYDDYAVLYYNVKLDPVNVLSLSTKYSSPQPTGKTILLRGNATGGTTLLYKFYVYDGNNWEVLRDYGRNNKFNWTPKKPGKYKLVVHVKDISSKNEYDGYAYKWFEVKEQGNIVLLTYHAIKKNSNNNSPWQQFRLLSDFENDMKVLKNSGISVKSYTEVINMLKQGKEIFEPTIIIQFDDGGISDYQYAFPVLKKYNLKATFFITPGRTNNPGDYFMSWSHVKEMYNYRNNKGERLFEFGAHGQTHTRLSREENENYNDWLKRLRYELGQPQIDIEKNLGFKPNLFALPFGAGFGSKELNDIAKSLDYELVRGWKVDKHHFLNYNPENLVFVAMYNNSNIHSVIKIAKNQ